MKIQNVSIIMPCYNEEDNPLLEKTLKSIMLQTYLDNSELIIVDDASTDRGISKIKRLLNNYRAKIKIRIIRNTHNIGIAKSLNNGIKIAKGKYIARIDCGDIMDRRRLELQKNFLDKNKNIFLVGGLTKWINSRGYKIGEYSFNKKFLSSFRIKKNNILYRNMVVHTTWMIKKELFSNIGFYNPNYILEDYEFLARALSRGYEIKVLPNYLTFIWNNYKGGLSSTNNKYKIQKSLLDIKLKYFPEIPSFTNFFGLIKTLIGLFICCLIYKKKNTL